MLYLNQKRKQTPLLSIQGDMDTNIHCIAIMANYDAFALHIGEKEFHIPVPPGYTLPQ